MRYFVNDFGCRINQICASCSFNMGGDNLYRKCSVDGCSYPNTYGCEHWKLRFEGLKNAGKGGGVVKSKSYMLECFRKNEENYVKASRKRKDFEED